MNNTTSSPSNMTPHASAKPRSFTSSATPASPSPAKQLIRLLLRTSPSRRLICQRILRRGSGGLPDLFYRGQALSDLCGSPNDGCRHKLLLICVFPYALLRFRKRHCERATSRIIALI